LLPAFGFVGANWKTMTADAAAGKTHATAVAAAMETIRPLKLDPLSRS